jgi:RNA polymerase sigma-70 factor (ECF subfamily)
VTGVRALEDADTERLVARAQRGDASAFRSLYLRYYDLVYGYGKTIVKDPHEAEDVTQDVFIRAIRLLPRYQIRVERPFRLLLLRIARNRSIDYLRKQNRCDVQAPAEVEGRFDADALAQDGPGTFDALSDADLERCLKRLPLSQRQVLVLRYVFDMSPQEVADVIDATPQAVRNLQYRGLTFLRAALAPRRGPLAHAR